MEMQVETNSQALYGKDTPAKPQGSLYEQGLKTTGAILGQGMQDMAKMAAMGGNSLNLTRGVHNLEASNRKPLQTRNAQYDMLGMAPYEKGM